MVGHNKIMPVAHNDIMPVCLWRQQSPYRTLTSPWKFEMIGHAVEMFTDGKGRSAHS
jgi:hypothetical protein